MSVARTNLDVAREMWMREEWGEPRDEHQLDLWICFWLGDGVDAHEPWRPVHWTRPPRWVEDLVRS